MTDKKKKRQAKAKAPGKKHVIRFTESERAIVAEHAETAQEEIANPSPMEPVTITPEILREIASQIEAKQAAKEAETQPLTFDAWLKEKMAAGQYEVDREAIKSNLSGEAGGVRSLHGGRGSLGDAWAVDYVRAWLKDKYEQGPDTLKGGLKPSLELCDEFSGALKAVHAMREPHISHTFRYLEPVTVDSLLIEPRHFMRESMRCSPLFVVALAIASGGLKADADKVAFCKWAKSHYPLELTDKGYQVLNHAEAMQELTKANRGNVREIVKPKPGEKYLSAKVIAGEYGIPYDALRLRLHRIQEKHEKTLKDIDKAHKEEKDYGKRLEIYKKLRQLEDEDNQPRKKASKKGEPKKYKYNVGYQANWDAIAELYNKAHE